jgi:DNA-binding NtrC family response regulator
VEDDPSVLETNKLMLEDLRYRVLGAKNGQEALKIYDRHRQEISIVMTDAVMPRMDGISLLQALSSQDPDIKALVITGYPIGEETRKTLMQGTVDWIQKPVNLAELSLAVGRVLGKVS